MFRPSVVNALHHIHAHLEKKLLLNVQLPLLHENRCENEMIGILNMRIRAIEHDSIMQGRFCVFYVNQNITGMMFYILSNENNKFTSISTDIMCSPYALSLLCMDVCTEDKDINYHCLALKDSMRGITANRKIPDNFIDIFDQHTILVGVKKNKEENVSHMVQSHHAFIIDKFFLSTQCSMNEKERHQRLDKHNNWIDSMRNNLKENLYWEKAFGKSKATELMHDWMFPSLLDIT